MNSENAKTPSKAELLSELESIRDFLDEQQTDHDETIPTLTSVAIAENATEPDLDREEGMDIKTNSNDDETPSEDVHGEEALIEAYKQELDIGPEPPNTADTQLPSPDRDSEPTDNEKEDNAEEAYQEQHGVQSSLFDGSNSDVSESKPASEKMPKARGENPFLPPHIRERLGRHKEMLENNEDYYPDTVSLAGKQEIQGDLLTGFTTKNAELVAEQLDQLTTENLVDPEKEALIDTLIEEYLPKIEAKLRAKLRESTLKDDD